MITQILNELNLENGTNYKLDVLKKYSENELFKRVLVMTYDRVRFTYGITMKNVSYTPEAVFSTGYGLNLSEALDFLEENFCTRKITGNDAINHLSLTLESLPKEDAQIIEKVLGRDLKVNIGRTSINKVHKDLIVKPFYMRCDTYSSKTAKNISFKEGALVQLKADGTYRSVTVENGEVTFNSRSGEEYEYPVLENQFKLLPDGVYTGELTIEGITDRAEGNGLLNSDNVPHDKVIIELWDYITLVEYANAKGENSTLYKDRFNSLLSYIKESENIKIIPTVEVFSIQEALKQTSDWMSQGFEGAILKDKLMIFRDGTSKQQLKLKLEIDIEVRITSFLPGNKGSKNEAYFSAIAFENDEGTIKGQVGVTSMKEKVRDELFKIKDSVIGKVMSVQFNDLSKARGNDFYALSHPRYKTIRNDKDETDTLEKAFELRQMAMELK